MGREFRRLRRRSIILVQVICSTQQQQSTFPQRHPPPPSHSETDKHKSLHLSDHPACVCHHVDYLHHPTLKAKHHIIPDTGAWY